jgi:hypothetical protein
VCAVSFIYYSFCRKEHILLDVGVMCALLVLYTIVFEEHTLQDVGVMCTLLVLDIIVSEVKNIFCRLLGLCVRC